MEFTVTSIKFSYDWFGDFESLQYVTFFHLDVQSMDIEDHDDNSLNLAIAKFCPNLKTFSL